MAVTGEMVVMNVLAVSDVMGVTVVPDVMGAMVVTDGTRVTDAPSVNGVAALGAYVQYVLDVWAE